MAIESIVRRINGLPPGQHTDEYRVLLLAILQGMQTVAAKLDNDAGVTDTNYLAVLSAIVIS